MRALEESHRCGKGAGTEGKTGFAKGVIRSPRSPYPELLPVTAYTLNLPTKYFLNYVHGIEKISFRQSTPLYQT